jgi:hypothetical protein
MSYSDYGLVPTEEGHEWRVMGYALRPKNEGPCLAVQCAGCMQVGLVWDSTKPEWRKLLASRGAYRWRDWRRVVVIATDESPEADVKEDQFPPTDYPEPPLCDPWEQRIAEAQRQRTYKIAGRRMQRIPFGQDDYGKATDRPRCRDCNAVRGELHVPLCCCEQCPGCGGQALECECHDE